MSLLVCVINGYRFESSWICIFPDSFQCFSYFLFFSSKRLCWFSINCTALNSIIVWENKFVQHRVLHTTPFCRFPWSSRCAFEMEHTSWKSVLLHKLNIGRQKPSFLSRIDSLFYSQSFSISVEVQFLCSNVFSYPVWSPFPISFDVFNASSYNC